MKTVRPFSLALMSAAAAVLMTQTAPAATVTLFQDNFSPTGSGPGTNWTAYASGFPNVANDRITDGGRDVLQMHSSSAAVNEFGIQTAITIPGAVNMTAVHFDLHFQPRPGYCNFATMLNVINLTDAAGGFRIFTQDWSPGRVSADSYGSNAWSEAIWSIGNYYHFVVDVCATGSLFSMKDDAGATTLWSSFLPHPTLSQLSKANLKLVVEDCTVDGTAYKADSYIDSLTVTADVTPIPVYNTTLFSDDFSPNGAGPGSNWTSWASGYPNVTNERITDGVREVLHMYTAAGGGGTWGNHAIASFAIPAKARAVSFDVNFQPRGHLCGQDSELQIDLPGDHWIRMFTQDWEAGRVRGDNNYGEYTGDGAAGICTYFTYYHFLIDVHGTGVTYRVTDDARLYTLWTYTATNVNIGQLYGSSFNISLGQVSDSSDTNAVYADSYIDFIVVKADIPQGTVITVR